MGEIFERPLPEFPLPFTGERLTSAIRGQIEIEHFHRYLYAREFCRQKNVLDVASGEGYGSALLAQVAASVTGVEIARDAVDHARASYQTANLRFVAGDARRLPLDAASVDVVVSFETIEHFAEHDAFLQEVRRVLRPTGLLILSTPDRDIYSPADTPPNPYHASELSHEEFIALLSRYFEHVLCLVQRAVLGSVLVPFPGAPSHARPLYFEKMDDRHFEMSQGLPRAPYLVALASAQPINAAAPSMLIEQDQLGTALERVAVLAQELAATRSQAEAEAGASREAVEGARQALEWARQELATVRTQAANEVANLRAAAETQRQDMFAQIEGYQKQVADLRAAAETQRHDMFAQIEGYQKQVANLRAAAETQRQDMFAQIEGYQKQVAYLRAAAEIQRQDMFAQIEDCQRQLAVTQDLIFATRQALTATYDSLSWRITRPLRVARGFLAKSKG
jgi:SAM-dependent methyltransferase